ncbi:unnamed protein product [Rhizoctonia solani]|uniref:Uncharacterized protein n=1 Tax=Rhizoctonia solani TaxID=456999 RepID=A0A8H3I3N9_9AGAM|nr:unnamed protein product [Rhizoctonia solani]
MVAFISSLALFALFVPALAMPAPNANATVELSKRAITSPVFTQANCEGVQYYQKSAVEAAAKEAVKHLKSGGAVGQGNRWYPHEFRNYPEQFPYASNCKSKWYEFPIMASGQVFRGGQPMEDRVVIGSWNGADDAVVCGVMTHRNAVRNGFKECKLQ